MVKNLINIILSICILAIITACAKEKDDLSFSSIMLGKEFPDSLIQKGFTYYDSDMPSYEGTIMFNLPSENNVELEIVARIDPDSKKVYLISISKIGISKISDFYEMLRAKYGEPMTPFSDIKSSFSSLLFSSHRNLDLDPDFLRRHDGVILAMWHPEGFNSSIRITEYFYYPNKRSESLIYITYENSELYNIASEKAQRARELEENQREQMDRENYRRTHPFMNQDF